MNQRAQELQLGAASAVKAGSGATSLTVSRNRFCAWEPWHSGVRCRFARRMKVKWSGLGGGSLRELWVARATTS
jgi:hypothetical protein